MNNFDILTCETKSAMKYSLTTLSEYLDKGKFYNYFLKIFVTKLLYE